MSGISFRDLDPHDQALAATMNDCAIDFPSGSSELEATAKDQNLQAASKHLLRERSYAELQEDVAQALRKEGFKITWAAP